MLKIPEYLSRKNYFNIVEEKSLNILLIGLKGFLKEQLVEKLEKYGCNVITAVRSSEQQSISYIFHVNNFDKLTDSVYLAKKNQAVLIIVSTIENSKIELKVRTGLSKIIGKIKLYFFSVKEPASSNQGLVTINKILTEVFSYKKIQTNLKIDNKFHNIVRKKRNHRFNIKLSRRFWTSVSVLVVPLFVLFYVLLTFYVFFQGYRNLKSAGNYFKQGELLSTQKSADYAYNLFLIGEKLVSPPLPYIKKLNLNTGQAVEDLVNLSKMSAKFVSNSAYTCRLAQNIAESIVSSRISLHKSQLEELEQQVQQLSSSSQLMVAQLKAVDPESSFIYRIFNIKPVLIDITNSLVEVNKILAITNKFTRVLPKFLGFEKPQTYLLLFQNNTELRPTGGFIGSYGWLTISEGRLSDFKTEDVYTADGQLKGFVEPPWPIRKYLNQESWYLRDSNYDPDFAESAIKAEWFLKHEMNQEFDGVIAFDLNSVQEILRSIGGIYLNDYSEEITADNIFLKTQSIVQFNFFPGSTQKKDYLGNIARNMFIKLTGSKVSWPKLILGIKNSLDQKHILINMHDQITQDIIENYGWAGRVGSVSCKKTNCVSDYLMIVEANFGVNKANYLITRQATINISPIQDYLKHELIIDYNNEFPQNTFPGGSYFSFTRILLPQNVRIEDLLINQESILGKDVVVEKYFDKISVSFPLRIDPASQSKVKLIYSLPLINSSNLSLEYLIQKQPGVDNYPIQINIEKPGKSLDRSIESTTKITSLEITNDHLISLPLY